MTTYTLPEPDIRGPENTGTYFDGYTVKRAQSIADAAYAAGLVARVPEMQDIEQYRMQMAGICTAAKGYWKPSDDVHADYDTPALRNVAELYAKYDGLYQSIRFALDELGIPGPDYPAPVANAVEILSRAIDPFAAAPEPTKC